MGVSLQTTEHLIMDAGVAYRDYDEWDPVVEESTGISAQASDNSFNSSEEFADVLEAGDTIEVSGFTDSTNNGEFTVVSATTSKITVEEDLADEAAGEEVTIMYLIEEILGATTGGSTFDVTREIREVELDGLRGKAERLRRQVEENASLAVNFKELTADNLELALTSTSSTPDGQHDVITSQLGISDADYLRNVALVATVSGYDEPVVVLLKDALADNDLSLNLEDKDEGVLEIEFSAHYDPDAVEDVPYEIRYPS